MDAVLRSPGAGPAGPGRSEDGMSGKRKKGAGKAAPRAYGRLTRHERNTFQRMLVSVNLFFTSFANQTRRSRKGGFTACANVFSPIPVTL